MDLNQNSQASSHITLAYNHYTNKQYTEALRHYSIGVQQATLNVYNKSLIHSIMAIIYMHLNNYPEAHRILTQVQLRFPQLNQQHAEFLLLFIKVHSSLALIELINCCEEEAVRHIRMIVEKVQEEEEHGKLLLSTTLNMLFGVDSFSSLSQQCNLALQTQNQNGVILASLSLHAQLTNDLELAYQLEHRAYEIYKKKGDIVLMALSTKHLLHLSKQLCLSKTIIEVYQQELDRLMQTPQIYGISQNTLFRNYQQKISCGARIASMLRQLQNQLSINSRSSVYWLQKGIIKKLSHIENISVENQNIRTLISMVQKKGDQVLQFMNNSPLVREVIEEYRNRLELGSCFIRKSFMKLIWKQNLAQIPPKVQKIKEQSPIRKIEDLDYNTVIYQQKHKKFAPKVELIRPIKSQYHRVKQQKTSQFDRSGIQRTEEFVFTQIQEKPFHDPNQEYFEDKDVEMNFSQDSRQEEREFFGESVYPEKEKFETGEIHLLNKFSFQIEPKKLYTRENEKKEEGIFQQDKIKEGFEFVKVKNSNLRTKIKHEVIQKVLDGKKEEGKESKMKSNISITSHNINIKFQPEKQQKQERQHSGFQQQKPRQVLNTQTIQTTILPQQTSISRGKISERPPTFSQPPMKMTKSFLRSEITKLNVNSGKIRKLIKLCHEGEYFMKRHYSSDGGEEKFFQLTTSLIRWAIDEDTINNKHQSYKLKDVRGVMFGKASDTFLKECNKSLEPWRCFSLVFKKRTLDLYCSDQQDVQIWLPGITASLNGYFLKPNIPITLYSPGRALWKRMLLKLQYLYLKPLKKNHRVYNNANAYAIILFGRNYHKSDVSQISKKSYRK